MNRDELAASIDHTVLGPETSLADVHDVLDTASEYGMNACIPPWAVADATDYAPDVTVATVIGFPHGQHAPAAKRHEATLAWDDGADELDVVIHVGRLKSGDVDAVERELADVVAAVPIPVKVILETALLTDDEIDAASAAARDADADMVKTSTGFADGGATVADVSRMSEYLPVKASGGVGDYPTARAMFDAGAVRIGASSGAAIVDDYDDRT